MDWNETINAIERVLDKRAPRGASDESLIAWLNHLKTVWKSKHNDINGFIHAIKATPKDAAIMEIRATPEWRAKIATEKRSAKLDRELSHHGPGYCKKCHTYCYGDCQAN